MTINKKELCKNLIIVGVLAAITSQPAMAAGLEGSLGLILKYDTVKTIITLGFGLLTAYKWIDYFASFDPGNALTKIITPAVLTYLTFQWNVVLGWFGIQ